MCSSLPFSENAATLFACCNSLWGTLGRPFDKSMPQHRHTHTIKLPISPFPFPLFPLYTYTLAFLINFMQFVQPTTTRTAAASKKKGNKVCKKEVNVEKQGDMRGNEGKWNKRGAGGRGVALPPCNLPELSR